MRPGFRVWSVATATSSLGDSVSYFALGWAAAAHGPDVAGLVLTLGSIPLCFLILLGGAVADRLGVRRTMIGCDLAMVAVLTVFAVHAVGGASVVGLCLLALLSGTAAALRRPAEGVFPRLFVDDDALPRAMAQVSMLQQVARFSGPSLGGLLLGVGGLVLTAGVDAATFAVVLLTLVVVRPPYEARQPAATEPVAAAVWSAVRAALDTRGVTPMLLGVTAIAASVLPMVILCVPLAGHARGWSAGETGLVAGCWTLGTFVVTAVVSRWGADRPGARVLGPVVGAVGVVVLALTESVVGGAVSMVLLGVGTAIFTCTLFPVFVRVTPPDMLARFQSLLGLAQNAAVLVALPVLGAIAAGVGLTAAILVVAAVLLAAALPRWTVAATGNEVGIGARPT